MEYVFAETELEIVEEITKMVEHMDVDSARFVFDRVIEKLTKLRYEKMVGMKFEEELKRVKKLTPDQQEEYAKSLMAMIRKLGF